MIRRIFGFLIVCIVFVSCEEIVNADNIENDVVQILAPTNGAIVADGAISFNWESLSGADSYQLQIATPNFNAARQILLDSTVNSTSFAQSLEAKVYEWRIKGLNSAYETTYTLNAFEVVTDLSDENVQLTAPTDEATVTAGDISFKWKTLKGAENYRLQISTPDFSNASSIILDTLITSTNFTQTLEANSHKWRVKAINDISETTYTEYSLVVEEPSGTK